jgi:hypothetical protein
MGISLYLVYEVGNAVGTVPHHNRDRWENCRPDRRTSRRDAGIPGIKFLEDEVESFDMAQENALEGNLERGMKKFDSGLHCSSL